MRATLMYAAENVRVEDVADPKIQQPADAVVRIVLSCVCGSDLWPYKSLQPTDDPRHMGHEFLGVAEEIGSEVRTLEPGDVVVAPFVWADNTCAYCREGLQASCPHGGQWGVNGVGGRPGPGRPRPAGRRHPGLAARRRGLGTAAGPADPLRCPVHRLPRRPHRPPHLQPHHHRNRHRLLPARQHPGPRRSPGQGRLTLPPARWSCRPGGRTNDITARRSTANT